MSEIVIIDSGQLALSLRLPALGMPEILSFGSEPVEADPLFEIERSSRVNGMDIAVPSNVLLPTGGMGFFGWPAIAGHRGGRDFVAQFGHWEFFRDGHQTILVGLDPVAQLGLSITLTAHTSGLISMASKRIAEEERLLRLCPNTETQELIDIFTAKGLSEVSARRVALQLMNDGRGALDTLSREALGIDPTELGGNPWNAAGTPIATAMRIAQNDNSTVAGKSAKNWSMIGLFETIEVPKSPVRTPPR